MRQQKSWFKSAAAYVFNKITWVLIIVVFGFMLVFPLYESYSDSQLMKACMAEHQVPKCKITTVAVPVTED